MAYIHGGGFFMGTGNSQMHGPSPMMNTGELVLVTMNYRLGALGKNTKKTRGFGLLICISV
jgi:carboxylesterase type B